MYPSSTPATEMLSREHSRQLLRDAETGRATLALRRSARAHRDGTGVTTSVTRPRRWATALLRAVS